MSLAALAFAAGVVLLQQQAALPSLAWAWALIPFAALALRFRVACALLALLMGFMWAAVCAHSRMAAVRAERDELIRLWQAGTISDEVLHHLEEELDYEESRL